jgi:hypothetical protein
MEARDVARYLREHPEFFEEHADEIAEIFVPHPHGGHAIPIAERQIFALREKNADLSAKLAELVRYGGENDAIGERLHRSTLRCSPRPISRRRSRCSITACARTSRSPTSPCGSGAGCRSSRT